MSKHNGWPFKRLGDVCDFEGGSQPPKSEFAFEEKMGYVRFLQIRDFGSDKNVTYIPSSKKNRLCAESDILIGRYGASVGKILTGLAGAYNVALVKTIPNPDLLERSWFYNYLLSDEFQGPLLNVAARSAQAGFSKDDIYNFPVPVPLLPEQRRIVGILDEAFAGIAIAKANAEKNLRNARELFESALQGAFTRGGDGWVEKRLGDIAEFKNGLNFNQRSRGQSVRVVGVGDFHENYDVPITELQSITIDDTLDESYQIREGDLLTVRSNGSKELVGRCMLVPTTDEIISYSGFVIRIRCDQNLIVPRFLLHFMKSSATRARLTNDGGGANISNINQGKLFALSLEIPAQKTQKTLVRMLDHLLDETQLLESLYRQKLTALDALKKSLLHQAFSGKI